jgi:hypothetical protein
VSKFAKVLKVGIAACVFALSSAHASVLTWNLNDVTFDDGTVATGSFDYDSVTDIYSSWDINVEASSFLRAYEYEPGRHGGFMGVHSNKVVDFVAFPPESNGRFVHLSFLSALTAQGGNVGVAAQGTSWECNNCGIYRYIVGGSVFTGDSAPSNNVPEPGSLALLGLSAAALAFARRRKSA